MSTADPSSTPRSLGAAPGTLVHVGQRRSETTKFRVVQYDPKSHTDLEVGTVKQCVDATIGHSGITWIAMTGLHDVHHIGDLLSAFNIHPLIQEDVLNTHHQPKFEDHGDYLFITLKEIFAEKDSEIVADHFSLIMTERVVITFQEADSMTLEPVFRRIHAGKGFIRKRSTDYLAWAILDSIIDHYFVVLDALESINEKLDDQIVEAVDKNFARDIHEFRTTVTDVYRKIRPTRELVSALQRSESPLLDPQNRTFFSDLYDHTVHAVTTTEMMRESVASLRDLHMAAVSNRMNEVMKVLTTFATIFLPLTFLAGIYGMNFENMPELKVSWAYPALWCVFILATVLMVAIFKRKRWL